MDGNDNAQNQKPIGALGFSRTIEHHYADSRIAVTGNYRPARSSHWGAPGKRVDSMGIKNGCVCRHDG
ncbi:hypothetical protein IMF27_25630 [Pseudomonas sp. PCH199]|uniref:hypothetical protein n=1 Tax=unclassified Pseudomonas TaxID=196821 RepID=UPI000BDAD519|nr:MULTISPECIES: hypothetical protein [unclassified Pseudomonas]MCW8278517.1 hypothetical protein [Pseudomonas sp. PCH199]PAM81305.1 hypothetical protein CES87_26190 [Pseudomonas sp. ERMR1:02]